MVKPISAVLALSFAVCLPAVAQTASGSPSPAPLQTLPPEITHVVSRPICSVLRRKLGPAVGMMLQNDQNIAKGPDLFTQYNRQTGDDSPARNMTLLRMENLVGPIADNIVAIHRLLDDVDAFPQRPKTNDDVQAIQMKNQLLDALAAQEASLDIINGFVTTQQLGDMQHEGFGYIGAITGGDQSQSQQNKSLGVQSPPPGMTDPNQAGLPQDPHFIDPATIPGLSLGYNPVKRLRDGLEWTRTAAKTREDTAAGPLMQTVRACGGSTTPH